MEIAKYKMKNLKRSLKDFGLSIWWNFSALKETSNPPSSPFVKRGRLLSSLWKREVERDFMRQFQTGKLKHNL
jgi:hypothetical protein